MHLSSQFHDLTARPVLSTLQILSACVALAAPALLAYGLPPSATFMNQAAALVGWGVWLMVLSGTAVVGVTPRSSGMKALQGALILLLLAALAAPLWTGLPWSLALSNAGLIAAAALAAQLGAAAQSSGIAPTAFRAFCIGLVVAGLGSSAVGLVQVFAPSLADGNWVAHNYIEGRAVGNLRQPNHLSSLLLWAVVAVLWLAETRIIKRWLGAALALLFVFVVVLTASRTGTVSVLMLAVWGILDKRLSQHTRLLLLLAPVAYVLSWLGTAGWAEYSNHVFGGEDRFSTKGDISSSRYGIWANTLALIAAHPWAGVGLGEFNFAWSLTPFPGRPVAFFDHAHNLVLQFAVELGLPLSALVLTLLLCALFWALHAALHARTDADTAQAPLRRAAFMMVFLILFHSLLEYPLWYAYFLLPAAFAFGLCLEQAGLKVVTENRAQIRGKLVKEKSVENPTRPLLLASMLLVLGGAGSVMDYASVVTIFAPVDGAPTLAKRIEDGQQSVFFAHHADYAAATSAEHHSQAMQALQRAPHYLLDARLLQTWAIALNKAGDPERGRFVAQRLKEFKNEQAAPFFAACTEAAAQGPAQPFQCTPPTHQFGYEDFRQAGLIRLRPALKPTDVPLYAPLKPTVTQGGQR
jgi:O-antigen ligase